MVITKDADRLSRDKGQLFMLLRVFATAGVQIEYSEGPFQDGKFLRRNQDLDAARHARLSPDETCPFQGENHLVD
jgi:hypothetical protein